MRDRTRSSNSFCIVESSPDLPDDLTYVETLDEVVTTTNAVLLTLLWGNTVVTTRTIRESTPTPLDAFGMVLDDAPAFDVSIGREGAIVFTPAGAPIPVGARMRMRVGQGTSRLVVLAEPMFEKSRRISDFSPDSRTAALACLMLVAFPVLSFLMSLHTPKQSDEYEAQYERMQYAREMLQATAAHDDARDALLEKMTEQEDARGISQEQSGTQGTRHSAEEGSAGDPGQNKANSLTREALRTHAPARAEDIDNAKSFGMVSILEQGDDSKHSTSAFSAFDQDATRGALRGDAFDDSFGSGSYGLSGVGEGGGGKGEGVGLSNIGGIGLGTIAGGFSGAGVVSGTCDDACRGRLGGVHHMGRVSLRCDDDCMLSMRNGRLPPETIQRVIRQNFGGFRACYETGLEKDPSLEGRVAVKFVIDRAGAVSVAQSGADTTMPSADVTKCVVAQMMRVTFPQPEGGIVTVVYPLMFEHA